MPNPAIQPLSNAAAAAKACTQHGIGMRHALIGDSNTTDPNWLSKYFTFWERTWDLLLKACGGAVVQFVSTALTVDVYAAEYRIADTHKSYAGGTLLLTASATNYVYLDNDQVPKKSTSAFPADVLRLAIVTTDASAITGITDVRFDNFGIGQIQWWNTAAGASPNLAGFDLLNAGRIVLQSPTTLTVAGGNITPILSAHKVETEGGASGDDLNALTPHATLWPRLLVLSQATAGHIVTIVPGGSIDNVPTPGIAIGSTDQVLLVQYSATRWAVVAHQRPYIDALAGDLDAAEMNIGQVGALTYGPDVQGIVAGEIDLDDATFVMVDTQGGAPTDDLATLSALDHSPRILVGYDAAHVVTVKHGTSTQQIRLKGAKDFVLDGPTKCLIVKKCDDETFVELARYPADLSEMVGTSKCLPQDWVVFAAGVPTVVTAGYGPQIVAKNAGVILNVDGKCRTAPGAGGCIVDVRINGSSIFTSQAEMVNIANGGLADLSATKNAAYVANDVIDVEFEAVNAAADVTLTIHRQEAAQTAP